jgi:uncharacterized Zn finger protein
MADIPKPTAKHIRQWVGDRSFTLGQRYFDDEAISQARRRGTTLEARCQGSRDEAYRVSVTFKGQKIEQAECSCPVGDGGRCKHVAALLLTWRARPEAFREAEELDAALQRRSKEELIALIRQMLRREPDLESLLELPLPVAGAAPRPVNAEMYRRQAEEAFHRAGYEWGAASEVADDLLTLKEIGDGFLAQQDPGSAAAVYQGIVTAVLANHQTVHDEPGDLHTVIGACVEGLQQCWATLQADPGQRRAILRLYYDILEYDSEQGGIGLSDCLPDLVELATPEERRTMAGWVREDMAGADGWRRENLGGLLLDLEAETLDDETYLRVCRETGRRRDLVERLLQLGRLGEALSEAEAAGDWELLQLADLLVSHRHEGEAERLVRARSERSQDVRLLAWLQKRATDRKDPAAALELAQAVFARQPGPSLYKEIRALARKQKVWDVLRPRLLAPLRKQRTTYVLVPILLEEGEIDEALELVRGERPSFYSFDSQKLTVAKAAETKRPRAALEIYREHAEALIQQRGRANYAEACRYLKKVRQLYKTLGEEQDWARYLTRLREDNQSLRALHEELTKAHL